jgi:hypothetical protein
MAVVAVVALGKLVVLRATAVVQDQELETELMGPTAWVAVAVVAQAISIQQPTAATAATAS